MKTGTKIAIAAGAGAAAALAFNHVTEVLIGTAFDKEPPPELRFMEDVLRGSKKRDDYKADRETARIKLLRRDSRAVQIRAKDGTLLRGHWLPCECPKRIIIAMHGWRSSWAKDFGLISDFLTRSGCSVLYAEQRALLESEGEKNDCSE